MAEKEEREEGAEATEAAAPAKSSKKLFVIIGAVVFLIVAIGVPVLFMMSKTDKKENPELSADAASVEAGLMPQGYDDEVELLEGEEALGPIFPLETFIVNLAGGKYIRLQVQLEFGGQDVPRRFFARSVLIRDALIEFLASQSAEDLQDTRMRAELKSGIKDMVNEVLKKEEVKNVYFTQFIVQ